MPYPSNGPAGPDAGQGAAGEQPAAPGQAPAPGQPAAPGQPPEGWKEARFRHSPSFVEVLRQLGSSLLVSTYQAGKLVAIGTTDAGLHFSFHGFDQAMGVAANPSQIAVGARGQIWILADNSQLAPSIAPQGQFDRCFLARSATVTGGIHIHEMAWARGPGGAAELWVVNTLFSCLATLHPDYSFVPRWRPPFVSRLASEDRCHLNGVALRDGRPAMVTLMARTDEPGGWRPLKNDGGCILDIASGEAVTEGLSMPHSPRWYDGRLLVLNSGLGAIEVVDQATGGREAIASMPGYTRGLAFAGPFAFIGLSRIRETAVFGGVPIAERRDELKCGVGVVDLRSGATVATLEFESGVEEIFDVQVLPNARCVALGGQRPDQDTGQEIWVVPPEDRVAEVLATERAAPAAAAAPAAPSDEDVRGWVAQALALHGERRVAPAVELLQRAADARPRSAEILNHLGNALQDAGRQDEALEWYERALSAQPTFVPALQNLGHMLVSRGRTDEGIERLRQADRVQPSPVNKVLIATALPVVYASEYDLGMQRHRIETELQALADEGVEVDTTDSLVPTNFFAAYQGEDDRRLHENLGRIYRGVDLVADEPRIDRSATGGRQRIGFLSAYFRDHTIGRLNVGRIERLSRERFEVVVLSVGRHQDPMASRFEAAADHFVEVPTGVADARRLIADQQLDLLLFTDVGMNVLTYTLSFSRMAPVQCATWGHPVTTGSPTMDLFLSSELLEVPGAGEHYTEELVRPPTLATYYERPPRPEADEWRSGLGLDDGVHLYACPQTLYKFHPELDPLLAEILRRDPDGRLLLIEGRVANWTELLRERFSRTMPEVTDRIVWLQAQPREDFLRLLAAADVVLDPIHFGGGNTSYEALAMGSPVVTLPGEFMRSRITRALYERAGYTELVTDSGESYVETAVRLGTDEEWRSSVRDALLDACEPLYENPAEVDDLEEFLADATSSS